MKSFITAILLLSSLTSFSAQDTFTMKKYNRKFRTGLVVTNESRAFLKSKPHKSFLTEETPVPGKFSLRGQTGSVEDQGQCGSCWDFALTAALRGTHMIAGKDPGRLSYNYLLNCATTMWGCEGGDFSAADFLKSPIGAPLYGSDGPYTAREGKCEQHPVAASAPSYTLIGSNLGQYPDAPQPTFKDIAYAVGVLQKPVAVDIAADDNWMNYSHGTFNRCNSTEQLNHMVIIEGYNCEKAVDEKGNCKFDENGQLPNGQGLWIIRNSWSVSWGNQGYITMKATDSKGGKCNSVASDALFFNLE